MSFKICLKEVIRTQCPNFTSAYYRMKDKDKFVEFALARSIQELSIYTERSYNIPRRSIKALKTLDHLHDLGVDITPALLVIGKTIARCEKNHVAVDFLIKIAKNDIDIAATVPILFDSIRNRSNSHVLVKKILETAVCCKSASPKLLEMIGNEIDTYPVGSLIDLCLDILHKAAENGADLSPIVKNLVKFRYRYNNDCHPITKLILIEAAVNEKSTKATIKELTDALNNAGEQEMMDILQIFEKIAERLNDTSEITKKLTKILKTKHLYGPAVVRQTALTLAIVANWKDELSEALEILFQMLLKKGLNSSNAAAEALGILMATNHKYSARISEQLGNNLDSDDPAAWVNSAKAFRFASEHNYGLSSLIHDLENTLDNVNEFYQVRKAAEVLMFILWPMRNTMRNTYYEKIYERAAKRRVHALFHDFGTHNNVLADSYKGTDSILEMVARGPLEARAYLAKEIYDFTCSKAFLQNADNNTDLHIGTTRRLAHILSLIEDKKDGEKLDDAA